MKIADIIRALEALAPPQLQEHYDNAGLLTGNENEKVKGVLCTLDCTEAIVEEAINKKCNLIVAHHPIIFGGIKKLNGKNYVERTVIKAIKNNVAIYSIHTNLDNVHNGVNSIIAEKLSLKNIQVLQPKENLLSKLVTFCPVAYAEKVRNAIFDAGAGHIGEYDCCSFNAEGTGTYRASEKSNPFAGKKGKLHFEPEVRIETIFPNYLQNKIVAAMIKAHPYEEVAYDIYSLKNKSNNIGSGLTGVLEKEMDAKKFMLYLKKKMQLKTLKHTALLSGKIKKVALCGGAGSFLLNNAISSGSDIYISSDFKYHEYFDADGNIIIADIGHYESEQYTKDLIHSYLKEKFINFAVHLSKVNTNPINYL